MHSQQIELSTSSRFQDIAVQNYYCNFLPTSVFQFCQYYDRRLTSGKLAYIY